MRTAQTIEAQSAVKEPQTQAPKKRKNPNPNWRKNLVAPWKPGQSGNPGGKNQHDVAQEIAKAIFSNNPELIYNAFSSLLQKGNAYAFQVLADRAFGKMKDTQALVGHDGGPVKEEITVKFVRPGTDE